MKLKTSENQIDLEPLLKLAGECARRVGDQLVQRRPELAELNQVSEHDVKIGADVFAEKEILLDLKSTGISILSEESGFLPARTPDEGSGLCWIVDPLDGSLNYFQGIPFCCVSIALFKDWEPVLGILYDFNREDLYSGIVGQGAWLNGTPIQPSKAAEPGSAVMLTGFPVNRDFSESSLLEFVNHLRAFRKVRLLGSAALSLALIASGRADVYHEEDIMLWDVAAGCALVQAAGGHIDLKHSDSLGKPVSLLAHNGRLTL